MKKNLLLIIGDYPISVNSYGGASALIHNHLELLHKADWNIYLLVVDEQIKPSSFLKFTSSNPVEWNQVKEMITQYNFLSLQRKRSKRNKIWNSLLSLYSPKSYLFSTLIGENLNKIYSIISNERISLIWSEHLLPTLLVESIKNRVPIIYSHHDWEYKLEGHRTPNLTLIKKYRRLLKKRIEYNLVRNVEGVISGSKAESNEFAKLGAKRILYLPAFYSIRKPLTSDVDLLEPRIVHLGGFLATANRIGMQRFIDVCWQNLESNYIKKENFLIIGSLEGASKDQGKVLQEIATCLGFVDDLSTVLRPYDIHIVPWEHNTGTRTRLPIALGYKQVIVSTKAAASCLPELIHNENCILVDELSLMSKEIINLYEDSEFRMKIGDNARKTYEENFTINSNQKKFNKFLSSF